MSTQSEIARLANTSLKTVSRVINNDPLVKAETRERVEAVIAQVGYTPNQAARMMRSQKSNIVGFLAHQVATTPSSIDLVRGAQDVAWESGKQMMLVNIERGDPNAKRALAQLTEFRAEAIIYATVYHREIELDAKEVPHVLLNCFEAKTRFPTILPDDYQLGYDLGLEILSRGYVRPLFLNLAADVAASRLRADGFLTAGREKGHDFTSHIRTAAVSPKTVKEDPEYTVDAILAAELGASSRPDVIICGQDLMAVPVYAQLAKFGLAVGKDIGVASFDNLLPISRLMQPGLSTMNLPYYEMGRAAMTAAIEGAETSGVQRIAGKFIERSSL